MSSAKLRKENETLRQMLSIERQTKHEPMALVIERGWRMAGENLCRHIGIEQSVESFNQWIADRYLGNSLLAGSTVSTNAHTLTWQNFAPPERMPVPDHEEIRRYNIAPVPQPVPVAAPDYFFDDGTGRIRRVDRQ